MSEFAWIDLASTDYSRKAIEVQYCIIGAGAAGIYLATQLAQAGGSVVLLEAGPRVGVDVTTVGFDAVFTRSHYPGAVSGRFFGMGGSTTRWGGALVPHSNADLRSDEPSSTVWSHITGVVHDETCAVLQELGYPGGQDFETFAELSLGLAASELADSGLQVQSGLYLPFRRKNFIGLLSHKRERFSSLKVFFNAVAKDWEVQGDADGAARITSLRAITRQGNTLKVKADRYLICAGAIESARLLLELQSSFSQPVFKKTARPGCYLGDHLSLTIADVDDKHLVQAEKLFAPRFQGFWMRGFRFLEKDAPSSVPRAFTHLIFNNQSRGFELAKTLLGALQQRTLPRLGIGDLRSGISDLAKLAYGRFIQSRLYIPKGTSAHMQLDMEQPPMKDNRVSLSDQKDEYGRRITQIAWGVSDRDVFALNLCAKRFLDHWPGSRVGLPDLKPRTIVSADGKALNKPYDAYHPVGTCRMGEDEEAVVDTGLKVHGMKNLWVVSTGVLPSAGTANPTFTMLCLAQRLASRFRSHR